MAESAIKEKIQWVQPKLICEVEYAELTADDQLRQTTFLGLERRQETEGSCDRAALTRISVVPSSAIEPAKILNQGCNGSHHCNKLPRS